ncbi:hypothetical protein VSDG_01445 [Cytospora chrysosperma]|uniref:Uncharacterized protein n=1 Tax=Cytospora chrysosperma TaxID=252740 RepID=A0A423WJG2_CYTCH|nr:hypothetical protein VSDG_01445 [Valsa sordida]
MVWMVVPALDALVDAVEAAKRPHALDAAPLAPVPLQVDLDLVVDGRQARLVGAELAPQRVVPPAPAYVCAYSHFMPPSSLTLASRALLAATKASWPAGPQPHTPTLSIMSSSSSSWPSFLPGVVVKGWKVGGARRRSGHSHSGQMPSSVAV